MTASCVVVLATVILCRCYPLYRHTDDGDGTTKVSAYYSPLDISSPAFHPIVDNGSVEGRDKEGHPYEISSNQFGESRAAGLNVPEGLRANGDYEEETPTLDVDGAPIAAGIHDSMNRDMDNNRVSSSNRETGLQQQHNDKDATNPFLDACQFRSYPSHRLYNLTAKPDFLYKDAIYIRGQLPHVLNPRLLQTTTTTSGERMTVPHKICIDTSEWETFPKKDRWPHSDGQNPSIISLFPYNHKHRNITDNDDMDHDSHRAEKGETVREWDSVQRRGRTRNLQPPQRLDPRHLIPISKLYEDARYLAVVVVGNGQCKWNMNEERVEEYQFSPLTVAPTFRSLIVLLNSELETIGQLTLLLERDAIWGNVLPSQQFGDDRQWSVQQFDDARIFLYDRQIHISYRNGPRFGYEHQMHNPLYFKFSPQNDNNNETTHTNNSGAIAGKKRDSLIIAYVKASETFSLCCGRNIALFTEAMKAEETSASSSSVPSLLQQEEEAQQHYPKLEQQQQTFQQLKALMWVDPVTVVNVHTNRNKKGDNNDSSLVEERDTKQQTHVLRRRLQRRLRATRRRKKSNIHGTNGNMVPLPSTFELLGMAHFHRPEHRRTSEYALHGHHYTHALFTIGKKEEEEEDYVLKRISNEFVFRTMSSPLHPNNTTTTIDDADIIQFASGLDLIGSDVNGTLLISYGINDCESAAFFIDMEVVQSLLLLEVPIGTQVSDLMMNTVWMEP